MNTPERSDGVDTSVDMLVSISANESNTGYGRDGEEFTGDVAPFDEEDQDLLNEATADWIDPDELLEDEPEPQCECIQIDVDLVDATYCLIHGK